MIKNSFLYIVYDSQFGENGYKYILNFYIIGIIGEFDCCE